MIDEFDFEDNNIFDNLDFSEIPNFLNELGVKTSFNYIGYDAYKHIFHYGLSYQYNITDIFQSYANRGYDIYNNIVLRDDSNINTHLDLLIKLFESTDDKMCIFVDLANKKNTGYHTILLIYRKENNIMEVFDPNGITSAFYRSRLRDLLNGILDQMKDLNVIGSSALHGFKNHKIEDAHYMSLNYYSSSYDSNFGWCQIWSLLIYEMIYKFPEKTTTEIVNLFYSHLKDYNIDDYSKILNYIVKGYCRINLGRINMILKKMDFWFIVNSNFMNEYDPLENNDDAFMENLITDEMEVKVKVNGYDFELYMSN